MGVYLKQDRGALVLSSPLFFLLSLFHLYCYRSTHYITLPSCLPRVLDQRKPSAAARTSSSCSPKSRFRSSRKHLALRTRTRTASSAPLTWRRLSQTWASPYRGATRPTCSPRHPVPSISHSSSPSSQKRWQEVPTTTTPS